MKIHLPIVDSEGGVRGERADAQENRRKILKAAQCLVERKGAGFSMDELAEQAGVGKGTLYRRFQDKAEVCLAMLSESSAQLQEEILRGKGADPALTPLEKLDWVIAEIIRVHWESLDLVAGAFQDSADKFDHPGYRWQVESIGLFLGEAMKEGLIAPRPLHRLALLILATMDAPLLLHFKNLGVDRETVTSDVLRFVKPALR